MSPSAIRAKADASCRPDIQDVKSIHDQRSLRWWQEGYRFCIAAEMTSDAGAVVAQALDRIADSLPGDPDADATWDLVDARRLDALVALACGGVGQTSGSDGTCVVVHAELSDLITGRHHATLQGGALIHPDTAARMLCDAKMRSVVHENGKTVGIGYLSRVVPNWLGQQVRQIHGCCSFPGCHCKRFLISHHAEPWPLGPTDLTNLVSVCHFHHRLAHEGGWKVKVKGEGVVQWLRPDGSVFVPGPSPPT